jgi:hypothetical protein
MEVGTWNSSRFSLENLDAHIRTHYGANGAAGALPFRVIQDHVLIALVINGLLLAHQLVRAHIDTQNTSLAPVFVYFYCGHG